MVTTDNVVVSGDIWLLLKSSSLSSNFWLKRPDCAIAPLVSSSDDPDESFFVAALITNHTVNLN